MGHEVREWVLMRHFVAQDARPQHLDDMTVSKLGPSWRAILVADGTVTRLLEAQTLAPVEVCVVDQRPLEPPADARAWLVLRTQEPVVKRRVIIRSAPGGRRLGCAESLLVRERLPRNFERALARHRAGLAGALAELAVETGRELLWFGRDRWPAWVDEGDRDERTLTRTYRILHDRLPAILITEWFECSVAHDAHRAGLTRATP
jgi:chorismate-pyruvate lyase